MSASPLQSPLTAERALETVEAFCAALPDLTLPAALARYDAVLGTLLDEALAGRAPACAAGCSTCCHQPLLVGVVELLRLWFSDEDRFTRPAFARRLEAEVAYLNRLRRAGLRSPPALAAQQFTDARPCPFLDGQGACSVHAVRPFLCRNAYAFTRCTRTAMGVFGYGDLTILARRLRAEIHRHFDLARFDPPAPPVVRTETAVFYLPEGLVFVRDRLPLDALRPLFRT
ncbi:YkgJ family cysteine cluster protein [Myxococcota bacterium]|jgi:Fe-S-cluster containining protein|nr:YkgJ family cysteine cluster protein [Myxococcota bacterium]